MLNKLFKYEIKATARIFIPLYITLIIFSIINKIFNILSVEYGINFNKLTGFIRLFIYFGLIVGILVITLVVQIQRFYKSLLGDEGYLMFTLPVKPWQHILSKLFTSMIWIVISGLTTVLSFLIIMPTEVFWELMEVIPQGISEVLRIFGSRTFLVAFGSIIVFILFIAAGTLMIYSAIALGYLVKKHKLLASFGMYLGLFTGAQSIMIIFMIVTGSWYLKDFSNLSIYMQMQTILLSSLAYFSIITAGLFILTKYILDNKLNLE
ncbi:hypothetical protein [Acetivibrio clariflavus]|uniref:hypothetical protein n=1 Tax=Acetivibrio clariflavus TaxID=288965 RepID=UPI0004804C10|nr:hypothetical protein [Acetivibrio clariflavus]